MKCQALLGTLGPNGLFKRVLGCRPDHLHPEIVARAQDILGELSVKEVQGVSVGIYVFYNWVSWTKWNGLYIGLLMRVSFHYSLYIGGKLASKLVYWKRSS